MVSISWYWFRELIWYQVWWEIWYPIWYQCDQICKSATSAKFNQTREPSAPQHQRIHIDEFWRAPWRVGPPKSNFWKIQFLEYVTRQAQPGLTHCIKWINPTEAIELIGWFVSRSSHWLETKCESFLAPVLPSFLPCFVGSADANPCSPNLLWPCLLAGCRSDSCPLKEQRHTLKKNRNAHVQNHQELDH